MNASASALTREDEVQSKIQKVRTFGRHARTVSAALFGFGLVGGVVILLIIMFGPIPGSKIETAQFATPQLKVWGFLVIGMVSGISLAAMYQLYRLFGSLAAGEIYTSENVRRVRHVGILSLLAALLALVVPVVTAALISLGYMDAIPTKFELSSPSLSQLLSAFFASGLILLVSWIMDVGLYEKDHADALRRDADLVI